MLLIKLYYWLSVLVLVCNDYVLNFASLPNYVSLFSILKYFLKLWTCGELLMCDFVVSAMERNV